MLYSLQVCPTFSDLAVAYKMYSILYFSTYLAREKNVSQRLVFSCSLKVQQTSQQYKELDTAHACTRKE